MSGKQRVRPGEISAANQPGLHGGVARGSGDGMSEGSGVSDGTGVSAAVVAGTLLAEGDCTFGAAT